MGKFNDKISAEFHPPKKWILERALSYQNEEMEESALQSVGVKCPASRITCKKGFVTDLASVPRAIWWLISPWDIARAAIIHDLLYKRIREYRADNEDIDDPNIETVINNYKAAKKAADDVFLMAMEDAQPAVPNWKMKAAYYAVVLFGRWSILPETPKYLSGKGE
jgi:hypothetical protein|tara:strand:- start:79 stop:576 length:498 start_codon:yes stop_codon:yes gene_type:complete